MFVFLFVIAFINIHPPLSKKVNPKAELLITLTWPDKSDHDVDLWLLPPNGQPVGYANKQNGVIFLDRDDRGTVNDIVDTPTGKKIISFNQEIITFRGLPPGDYVVNVHLYKTNRSPLPVPCVVKMVKINPEFHIIVMSEISLHQQGEERTAFRFTIEDNGNVTDIDQVQQSFLNAIPYQAEQ